MLIILPDSLVKGSSVNFVILITIKYLKNTLTLSDLYYLYKEKEKKKVFFFKIKTTFIIYIYK